MLAKLGDSWEEQVNEENPHPNNNKLPPDSTAQFEDWRYEVKKNWGLIAARPKGVRTPIRTPKKNGVQPLHAALERRAEAARPSPQVARHSHAFNRRAYGVQPCQTGVQSLHACLEGVQSLHACLEGVQSLHALRTGVQALHACWLTSNCAAHVSLSNREAYVSQPRPVLLELTWARVQKPATKFNHPDPQANDRPRPTDTHQTQPSR
ncbi:hypothetical protein PCASD_13253 [Puccinia coronata f. sp. avenae]|uniref:Uncharacterized protein n=1 Tax=Puccinia coronata f. sp. avenae TaxID=200324 RepID=A0A2N5UGA9_9BASI|nr:hypothetical protein PCASD_13253 [Puccinia coronata f. sp. avenae]